MTTNGYRWIRLAKITSSRTIQLLRIHGSSGRETGMEIKETAIQHGDGHVSINKTTKVTGKGQQYFINRLVGGTHATQN